jgi:hypothetical protein
VLLLVTAAVIVGAVIFTAIGRGGQMAMPAPDTSPLQPDVATAADIALLRPPWALWGYQRRATDEVLGCIAQAVTERDVEIATLRRQLGELQSAAGQQRPAASRAAQHARPAGENLPSPPEWDRADQGQPGRGDQDRPGRGDQGGPSRGDQDRPGRGDQGGPSRGGQT